MVQRPSGLGEGANRAQRNLYQRLDRSVGWRHDREFVEVSATHGFPGSRGSFRWCRTCREQREILSRLKPLRPSRGPQSLRLSHGDGLIFYDRKLHPPRPHRSFARNTRQRTAPAGFQSNFPASFARQPHAVDCRRTQSPLGKRCAVRAPRIATLPPTAGCPAVASDPGCSTFRVASKQ